MKKKHLKKFKCWSAEIRQMSAPATIESWLYSMSRVSREEDVAGKFPYLGNTIWLQFTGMIDKNGVEIYEGDICKFEVKTPAGLVDMVGVFDFDMKYFAFGIEKTLDFDLGIGEWAIQRSSEVGLPEVIGNIYENAELAKQKV